MSYKTVRLIVLGMQSPGNIKLKTEDKVVWFVRAVPYKEGGQGRTQPASLPSPSPRKIMRGGGELAYSYPRSHQLGLAETGKKSLELSFKCRFR